MCCRVKIQCVSEGLSPLRKLWYDIYSASEGRGQTLGASGIKFIFVFCQAQSIQRKKDENNNE